VVLKIFRSKFPDNTKLNDFLIIGLVAIPTILCSLTNTDNLIEGLKGPGLNSFRANHSDKFFTVALFSLVKLDKAMIFMAPLYLISQYFYLSWQKEFQTQIYSSLNESMRIQMPLPVDLF
jgi:hypothetical protein